MSGLGMVSRAGGSKQVPGYAQFTPAIEKLLLIFAYDFLRRLFLLLGAQSDGRPMLVAARNHQYFTALKAMIPGKDVRRQVCPGDMSQMKWAISIRPGNTDKNSLSQFYESPSLYVILSLSKNLSYPFRSF